MAGRRPAFLVVSFAIVSLGGLCCSTAPPKPTLTMAEFYAAREPWHASPGEWVEVNGGVANDIPPDALPADVRTSKDGIGVSLALKRDFAARDCVVDTQLAFLDAAAAGVVLRAQEADGVANEMYLAVINFSGVHLWRLHEGKWVKLQSSVRALQNAALYRLRLKLKAESISVALNGEELFSVQDGVLMEPGKVGICAREGLCRYVSFEVKSTD